MPLIDYRLDCKVNKVKTAIDRIRTFDPTQNGSEPYYVAYSGGKDSDAIRILFELSGVKYDLWHNHTTVDAPETVRYIRSIPNIQISYPSMPMWDLIVKQGVPPTRIIRYCCAELKERNGRNRFVVTGVRWEESTRRKNNRSSLEIQASNIKNKIMLNADNSENRMLFESCTVQGKRVLNPIIDWSADEVWEFLHHYNCRSNPLYQQGYRRIGCVGCPMGRTARRLLDFERYPKYKHNYISAFERMLTKRIEEGKKIKSWETGEGVFNWWIEDIYRTVNTDMSQIRWEEDYETD